MKKFLGFLFFTLTIVGAYPKKIVFEDYLSIARNLFEEGEEEKIISQIDQDLAGEADPAVKEIASLAGKDLLATKALSEVLTQLGKLQLKDFRRHVLRLSGIVIVGGSDLFCSPEDDEKFFADSVVTMIRVASQRQLYNLVVGLIDHYLNRDQMTSKRRNLLINMFAYFAFRASTAPEEGIRLSPVPGYEKFGTAIFADPERPDPSTPPRTRRASSSSLGPSTPPSGAVYSSKSSTPPNTPPQKVSSGGAYRTAPAALGGRGY